MVFQAATSRMNLSDELDLEDYVNGVISLVRLRK